MLPMPVMPDTCALRVEIDASYAESSEPVSVTEGVATAACRVSMAAARRIRSKH